MSIDIHNMYYYLNVTDTEADNYINIVFLKQDHA